MTTRLAVPVRFGVPARFAVPVAVLIVGLSTGTLAGLAGWRRASGAASTIEDVLPAFTEPGEGRRAKDTDGFGLAVGRAHLAEVERFAAERKLTCRDTSARALYRAAHAAKDEGGEAVDAGSSASARSSAVRAMLQNPQIRLSCEGTRGELIGDRPRTASEGRLLFLFDSAAHPLRHVSFRRIHTADARALEDAEETLRALTARFGPPAVTGDLPSDRSRAISRRIAR